MMIIRLTLTCFLCTIMYAASGQGLTDAQLIAQINHNPPLQQGQLKTTLLNHSPLSESVMTAVVARDPAFSPGILKELVLANSPISNDVAIAIGAMELPDGILNAIIAAQPPPEAGFELTGSYARPNQPLSLANLSTTGADVWYFWEFYDIDENGVPTLVGTSNDFEPTFSFTTPGTKEVYLMAKQHGWGVGSGKELVVYEKGANKHQVYRLRNNLNTILKATLNLCTNPTLLADVYQQVLQTPENDYNLKYSTLLNNNPGLFGTMKNSLQNNGGDKNDLDNLECIINSFKVGEEWVYPSIYIPYLQENAMPDFSSPPYIGINVEDGLTEKLQVFKYDGRWEKVLLTPQQYLEENIVFVTVKGSAVWKLFLTRCTCKIPPPLAHEIERKGFPCSPGTAGPVIAKCGHLLFGACRFQGGASCEDKCWVGG